MATTRSSGRRPGRTAERTATSGTAASRRAAAATAARAAERRQLDELRLLHEFAQLATQARDWDELMRTLVDRTTVALGVEVCSFYLPDREFTRLTLAATNGLDTHQIGKVSLAVGEGITGAAAATRRPIAVPDVRVDPRFKWIRGFDQAKLTSFVSMPLVWNDRVIGVLNVQSVAERRFTDAEIEFLGTIAALLAGIVEKGRLQAEAEAQVEQLTALDQARAELLSVVTHELRTPLSVVRAYLDLLTDAALGIGDPPRASVEVWRDAAIGQVDRLDRLVDSILTSVQGEGLAALERQPFDVRAAATATVDDLRPVLRAHRIRWETSEEPLLAVGDEARFRQVLEQLLENEAKYAAPVDGVSIGAWRDGAEVRIYVTDDGEGIPSQEWESVFEAYVRRDGGVHSRGSGIGLFAARRLMSAMGGRVWLEPNGFGGSRFVVALPAAEPGTGPGERSSKGQDG